MSVQLVIADGSSPNWFLSESIWVVPGPDPTGNPDIPFPGQSAFLWARVTNDGDEPVSNAVVRFWWANPRTAARFQDLVPVGSSQVSLDSGETKEVLCLSAWHVVLVNGGHECLFALALSEQEELP